jgi:hypothetical protein
MKFHEIRERNFLDVYKLVLYALGYIKPVYGRAKVKGG